MPRIGERRTVGGQTGEWDGRGWLKVSDGGDRAPAASSTAPRIGEERTVNGQTGWWDGRGWRKSEPRPPAPEHEAEPLADAAELGGNVFKSGTEFVSNFASGVVTLGNLYSKLTQTLYGGVFNPRETVKVAEEMKPLLVELINNSPQLAGQAKDYYKDRLWTNLGKTAWEDPVGLLSDVSTLLTLGAGGVLKGASMAGKIAEVAQLPAAAGRLQAVARGAGAVGEVAAAADPLSLIGRTAATTATKFGPGWVGKTLAPSADRLAELGTTRRGVGELVLQHELRDEPSALAKAAAAEQSATQRVATAYDAPPIPGDVIPAAAMRAQPLQDVRRTVGTVDDAAERIASIATEELTDPRLVRTAEGVGARFPEAGRKVGGIRLADTPKNKGNLPGGQELPGVRRVPVSEMDPNYAPPKPVREPNPAQAAQARQMLAAELKRRGLSQARINQALDDIPEAFIGDSAYADMQALADNIASKGKVKPIFIALDENRHPYILQGGHRYDAMRELGMQEIPAVVIIDPARMPPSALRKIPVAEGRTLAKVAQKDATSMSGVAKAAKQNIADDLNRAVYDRVPGVEGDDARQALMEKLARVFKDQAQRSDSKFILSGALQNKLGLGPVAQTVGGMLFATHMPTPVTLGAMALSGGLKAAANPRVAIGTTLAAQRGGELMMNPKVVQLVQRMRAAGQSDAAIQNVLAQQMLQSPEQRPTPRLPPMDARGTTDPASARLTNPPPPSAPPPPVAARPSPAAVAPRVEPRLPPMDARGTTDPLSARLTEPPPPPVRPTTAGQIHPLVQLVQQLRAAGKSAPEIQNLVTQQLLQPPTAARGTGYTPPPPVAPRLPPLDARGTTDPGSARLTEPPAAAAAPAKPVTELLPELQSKLARVQQRMKEAGFPVTITSKVRTAEKQKQLYDQGRGKPGNIVTNADGTIKRSRHQSGTAADLAFLVNGKVTYAEKMPWALLGRIAKEEGLEWGGDWTKQRDNIDPDRPHVQLPKQESH
jgi:peptidoglycan L-alanyl-D-glutamate endopeptidase CwlK